MRSIRSSLLFMTALVALSAGAAGQSVSTFEAFKGANPSSCTSPPSANSFVPADGTVNVYLLLNSVHPGDVTKVLWLNPAGANPWDTVWDPAPNDGYPSRCYWFNLDISKYIAPTWGLWSAQITVNDKNVGSPISFQVNSAGAAPPAAAPQYEGSFDGADCSHIFGWARNKQDPNAVVSVDISVDGSFVTTVSAGDSRSDLTQAGIGNHAFNFYSLPPKLKDGYSHSVRVVYSGTAQDLPGSVKMFQNPCTNTEIGPSNVQKWTYDNSTSTLLNGFSVTLEKEKLGDGKYQYRVNITPDWSSPYSLDSAHLTVVTPNAVRFDRSSSSIEVNHQSTQQILSSPALNWEAPPSSGGDSKALKVTSDMLGLLFPTVGTIQGLAELSKDLSSADASVGPSSWFDDKMNDENDYHVYRMYVGELISQWSLTRTHGIRFMINEVDEGSGQAPEFLAIAKDSSGAIVGVEIGLDRKIIPSCATGKPSLFYPIIFM